MGKFTSIEEAREYFHQDRFATRNHMELEQLGDGFSVCSMPITPDCCNANGGVMGGAIFTLADLAFAAASNHLHMPTVALDMHACYLSQPKGQRLIARADLVKDGRTTCVYNIDIKDDLGRAVARVTGTGYKLEK